VLQFEELKKENEGLKRQKDSLLALSFENKTKLDLESLEPNKTIKNLETKDNSELYVAEKKAAEENVKKYAEKLQAAETEILTLKESLNEMEDVYVSYFEIKMEKDTGEDGLSDLENKYYGKIKTDPDQYFDTYVQIINKSETILNKAIIKNRFGSVISKIDDPLVINTNNFPKGIYYLSFYDENGKLIQKAKVMIKR
jgi:hypothetical protein